jgi:hypothetical protein
MSDMLNEDKLNKFAFYAEKHGLYELLSDAVQKLVIHKPNDPYMYLINFFSKNRGNDEFRKENA